MHSYIYGWQDYNLPFLRCYTDSLLFYQSNNNIPCDTFINSIFENEIKGMVAFPNPTYDLLKITHLPNHSQFQITILDSQGRECILRETKYGEQNIVLDVHQLVPGLYFCLILNEHYKRIVKIIKY